MAPPGELDERPCGGGRPRPNHFHADALTPLEGLPSRDEGAQDEVAERTILAKQLPQLLALDRDVAQRLRHGGCEKDRLARQQVGLAEEAARAVPDDLTAGRVEDRNLTLQDRDQRVAVVADPEQRLADECRPL